MTYSVGVQRDDPSFLVSTSAMRELTPRSVVLGIALALILGAANAYLGLYAGLTVSASIPAAVISMAILRMLGGSTILENNVVQTIASAGEAVAAGAIFTFPALVILGGVRTLPYVEVTALCVVGATMGALLVVFLRRAYIVEERLPFPEGVACAQVLRAGDAQANVRPLVIGGLISAALKALQDVAGVIPGAVSGARWVGSAAVAGSLDVSAALIGVGYIIGIRIAALVFAGGAFAWLIAIPVLTAFHPHGSGDAATTASQLWSGQVRYLGVGAMLTGGVVTLWKLRTRIASAIADSIRVVRSTQAVATAREDTDLSARAVLTAVALCVPVIFAICLGLSGQIALSAALAVLLTLICFFATAIAGYLTGIVGASNNPVSGVTVIVLLAVALFLKLVGVSQSVGPQLAILSGAIVCTAALARNRSAGRRDRVVIFDGADSEPADRRLRNRRHSDRAGRRARRSAGVSDGESDAGSFPRRIAARNDRDRRCTRGDSRIQRSLPGTDRIEMAYADHACGDRSLPPVRIERSDFYRRAGAFAFRIPG
jgi:putative OPT family oligopeptide transporter